MTKLYGLFSNQKEAEQAVSTLAEANLDDSAIHTMERWNADNGPMVIPSVQGGSGSGGGGAIGSAIPFNTFLPDFSMDNDAKQFFQRSLERGGVLVTIDPEDDTAFIQAKRILEQQGGQVLSA
jgi:hypothetical protein